MLLSIPHVIPVTFRAKSTASFWNEVCRHIVDIAFVKGDSRSGICDDGLHVGRRVFDGILYLKKVVGARGNDEIGGIVLLTRVGVEGEVGKGHVDRRKELGVSYLCKVFTVKIVNIRKEYLVRRNFNTFQPNIRCKRCVFATRQEAKIGGLMRKGEVELVGITCVACYA